jgi:outer membrane lipase/esterase
MLELARFAQKKLEAGLVARRPLESREGFMTIMVKSDRLGRLAPVPRLRWPRPLLRPGAREPQPSIVRTFALLLLIGAPLWFRPAHAQSPALQDMVSTLSANGTFEFNALERQAAIANDSAYAKLQRVCGGAGQSPAAPAAGCTGNTLTLYNRLRELENNANELLGKGGETQYSLRLDPKGMSEALRWTAPEEYAAQGSMASKFVNSQASVLTNRFSALRFAAQGIPLADGVSMGAGGNGFSYAYNGGALGGSAGADSAPFSRWSIFANGGFGSGNKSPTTYEDAFFFDSTEVSAGADVRLTNRLVVGILFGHTEKRIDFNAAKSIVDGGIRGNGQSAIAYVQYDVDSLFANVALGWQHLSLATRRRITYPSNNPDIPSVDVTSLSNTGSTALIGTLGAGYSFHYKGLTTEPYVNLQNVSTHISAFTEHSNDGFDIYTPSQSIQSLEGSVGLRAQYAILNPLGVIVPYVYGEYRHQFRDSSRNIASGYAAAGGGTDFVLPTDPPAKHYYVVGGGGSVVLKHGLQGFIQYARILDYTNYTDHTVSGGIRWEL